MNEICELYDICEKINVNEKECIFIHFFYLK